jgi:hypothetical protein
MARLTKQLESVSLAEQAFNEVWQVTKLCQRTGWDDVINLHRLVSKDALASCTLILIVCNLGTLLGLVLG